MKRDDDLVLIGIGAPGFPGFRRPTAEDIEAYEASKKLEALDEEAYINYMEGC